MKKIICLILLSLTLSTVFSFTALAEENTEDIPTEHIHNYKITSNVVSDCIHHGEVTYTCTECQDSYTEKLPLANHKIKVKNIQPSYFDYGYKNQKVCSVCGKILNKGTKLTKKILGNVTLTSVISKEINIITVKWNKVKNATGYIIYRKFTGQKKYTEIGTVKDTAFNDKNTKCGVKCYYKIKAFVNKNKKTVKSKKYSNVKSVFQMPKYKNTDGFEESPIGATVWFQSGKKGKILNYNKYSLKVVYKTNKKEHKVWVSKNYVLINLPQVVPTAVYDIYNCYNSQYPVLINGKVKYIPNLSGKNIYGGKKVTTTTTLNGTIKQWAVPCFYSTAQRFCKAQKKALLKGDCIKVIDTYRSIDRTRKTYNTVYNSKYSRYIGMSVNSFLSKSYSNHNKGIAVDCSLIKLSTNKEYKMQTPYNLMNSKTCIENNNKNANRLQGYMKSVGFSPLSTEWYHFTDYHATNSSFYANFNYPKSLYN